MLLHTVSHLTQIYVQFIIIIIIIIINPLLNGETERNGVCFPEDADSC